ERVDEPVLARALEAGQRLRSEAERVELLRAHLSVGHDARDHALAPPIVRSADHGHLPYPLVAGEQVLHLQRMDVLAAGDDHVVEAAFDPEVAVLVDPPDVAGVVPALANRVLVGVRPVPVAPERLVGAHVAEDLAALAEPEA